MTTTQAAPQAHVNLSSAELIERAVARGEGRLSANGALVVNTGLRTGRSPKDRYIVDEPTTRDSIDWGSVNRPFDADKFSALWARVEEHLESRDHFVAELHVGSDATHYLPVRVTTETAWQNLFGRTMFVRPQAYNQAAKDEWTILNAAGFECDPNRDGTNSDGCVIINFAERKVLIAGMRYAGEMKKAMFSVQNFLLPASDVLPMHCSANVGEDGETCLFFGLSGTGKTTLSADQARFLIGDDEHGWDDDGVFNFEGGCYAKTINLSKEAEPDIYNAIRRDALLENVTVREDGSVDFDDNSKTENTRVSYPIYHIDNIVKPVSKAGHAKKVIFLTADAFGVLPPVSKLTKEQAQYHFLSGFTAKLAGTERGVTEPTPTFSSCFGAAFLSLHPTQYAEVLVKRMEAAGAEAYLVNTGWNGTGKRISIKATRAIIDAILDGSIEDAEFVQLPYFNLAMPTALTGVEDSDILDPRNTYDDKQEWDLRARDLAKRFVANFEKFTDTDNGKALVDAGPKL